MFKVFLSKKHMKLNEHRNSTAYFIFVIFCIGVFLLGGYLIGSNQNIFALGMVLIIPAIFVFLNPFLGVLIFAFLIPLESAFLGFGGGAVTATRLLGIFIFVAWFAKLMLLRKKIEVYTPVKWAMLFFVWALVSFIWAWNQDAALQRLQTGIQLFFLMLMFTNEINSVQKFQKVMSALLLAASLAGILGILGIGVNQSSRLLTLEGQGAKEYAAYIGIVFLVTTILLFYGNAKYRLLFGFIGTMSLIPLFASGERGIILALTLAWLAIIVITPRRGRQAFLILFVLGILSVTPLILQQLGLISDWTVARFTINSIVESGGANRTDIWKTGLVLVQDNLFFGVGIGNFTSAIGQYIGRVPIQSRFSLSVDPHGDWLSILGELGLIGFLIFGMFLIGIGSRFMSFSQIYKGYLMDIPIQILIAWGLFVYLISIGMTSTFMYRKVYWLGLAIAILVPHLFNLITEMQDKET
jgi:O-antigen ligase